MLLTKVAPALEELKCRTNEMTSGVIVPCSLFNRILTNSDNFYDIHKLNLPVQYFVVEFVIKRIHIL